MTTLIIQLTAYSYLLLAFCFAIIYLMMKYSVTEEEDFVDVKQIDKKVDAILKKENKNFKKNSNIHKVYQYLKTDEGKLNGINVMKCYEMFGYRKLTKIIYKLKEKGFEIEKKKINKRTTYFLK